MPNVFDNFLHVEDRVQAACLSSDNHLAIADVLRKECINGQLNKLSMVYNENKGCMEFSYRYKSESTDNALSVGDYIVRKNTGAYEVREATDFLSEYIDITQDPTVDAPQTPAQSVLSFLQATYPDAGIKSVEDLHNGTIAQLLVDGLASWYDSATDTFDIKFTDCSIVSPLGLNALLSAMPRASYMTDETKFILNFNNGAYHDGDANTHPNLFNYIALQELLGEIKDLPVAIRRRLTGISFMSQKKGVPSAIAPSVTTDQWIQFLTDIMKITGIASASDIRR